MLRGRIFYRGEFVEAGIEVENGRITRIGKLVDGRRVDGVILPAGIDVHVHFRDFKEKHKETIESGTKAAMYGGICLVIDQPNTKPVVDSLDVYFRRMDIAKKHVWIDYALNLALTNSNYDKIDEIVEKIRQRYYVPAIGEVFIQHNSENLQIGYKTLEKVVSRIDDIVVSIHAEDPKYIKPGTPNFKFREKRAEIKAVERVIEISSFHFCHISTRDAAEIICRSKSTFEVAPHHMLLSIDDYERLGYKINVNPPLRSREEAEWLLNNLHLADVIASDHAPHTLDDKKIGSPGFPGVETMYPIFVFLASKGIVNFRDLVDKIAINPSRIFGLSGYGEIEVGKFANFAVFNLKSVETITSDKLHSKCGWTPYEGFKAVFPVEVYLRGVEILSCEERLGRVLESAYS